MKHIKIIVTAIITLLLISPTFMEAKKKKQGKQVRLTLVDDTQMEGELLMVRETSLLIYQDNLKTGGTYSFKDIVKIRVMKKSKWSHGAATGFLVGASLGLILGSRMDSTESMLPPPLTSIVYAAYYGFCTAAFGGIVGALLGADKIIKTREKSPQDWEQLKEKLRPYARLNHT